MKPKICIIVSGGVVQEVYSSQEIELELIDFDDLNLSTTKQEEMCIEKTAEFPYIY